MTSYETKTFGKWILAGEHAVLRGSPALVFPLASKSLFLNYMESSNALNLQLAGEHGPDLQLLFWGVLEKACNLKGVSRYDLKGSLRLENDIPIGAGMGASAAFCVAISRWFSCLELIKETEIYDFSVQLENLFHGESSGVDIAIAMTAEPLIFVREQKREKFIPTWKPQLYISYSGKRGVTLDCVNKVKDLIAANPSQGEKIDHEMKQAVETCRLALKSEPKQGLALLAQGMEIAANCFQQWGLTEGAPEQQMRWLKENGALAVKPTGSGGGGYILSLWDHEPKPQILKNLISCF